MIKGIMNLLVFAITLFFPFQIISSSQGQEIGKVYTFTYSEIRSFMNFVVPAKYIGLLDDIRNAKIEGKSNKEISLLIKERYGLTEEDLGPICREMKIPPVLIDYTRDIMLNRKPILRLIVKGAITIPKGSPQYTDLIENLVPSFMRMMDEFKDHVQIKVQLYPGGVLGDEPDFIRKMKLGELQFAGGTLSMGEMISPALSVFDLPFLFDYEPKIYYDDLSYCQIDWILGKASATINRLLEENGFILAGLSDGGGYASILTGKVQIRKADDLKKITFFAFPQSRIAGEINKAFGFGKTIVCNLYKIPALIATGMLDSMICCWYAAILSQSTPYFKYVTDYPIRGVIGGIGIQSKEMSDGLLDMAKIGGIFVGITGKDALKMSRKILVEQNRVAKEVMRRKMRILESKAKQELLNSGTFELVKIPEAELEKIKNKILPLYNQLADKKGSYPKWFLEEILKYREEYRSLKKRGKLTDRWYKKGIYPDGYDEFAWARTRGK